jgi:hypothetical protein
MKQYEKCLDDIKKLKGLPPHGFNLCYGDGYFYESLKKKYSSKMLEKALKECNEIDKKVRAACESCSKTKEEKLMELKTVEEYSREMTREEFDKFTEEQELCPSDLGLRTAGGDEVCSNDCIGCWDNVLVGITFKAAVPSLPKKTLPVLKQLEALEIQSKSIEEKQKKLKEDLLQAMEKYGVKKWDNEVMTISYVAPTTKSTVDSKKLKEELPDIFSKYIKTSNVKSSIRVKLKGGK